VLSTPDDDFFEYDILKIDKDSGGQINLESDNFVILMIYYKYKWAIAIYDMRNKRGTYIDYKADENMNPEDTYQDLAEVFKTDFNISVDDFAMDSVM
jgi:hypothetical protein